MPIVKIVPMPGPQGPAGNGQGGDTGDITFEGNSIIGDGTMNLVPNADLLTNEYSQTQYLIIDPTAPNHIHIRAGGNIDESTAELILGGERNKVSVSDLYKSIAITTAATITNTYVNAHEANTEDLIVPETSDILIGDNIVIAGINHPVTYFSPDPNNDGFSIVRATGVTFVAGESYTFVREEPYENYWSFGNGELSFPNGSVMETQMDAGHLIISTAPSSINNGGNIELNAGYTLGENKSGGSVSIAAGAAGAGSAGGSVYISTSDTGRILLSGDGGEFLNNMNIPENQIATLGDFGYLDISSATDPVEGPLTTLTAPSNLTIQTGGEPAGEITIQADKGLRINYNQELGGAYLNGNEDYPETQIATLADIPTGATGSFISNDNKTITVTNGIITAIEAIV